MKLLKMKDLVLAVAAAAVCLCLAPGASAQTYNTSTDFSTTSSSAGVWTYGDQLTLGGALTNYTVENSLDGGAIQLWNNPDNVAFDPSVFKNMTDQTVTFGTLTLNPYETAFHPGQTGQYSVYQFTAPTAGTYDINSTFGPRDSGRTSVYVLAGGNQIYTDDLATDPNASFTGSETLSQGETVDFAVGFSPGNGFNNDTTAIDATVSRVAPVPEAATSVSFALLLAMGGMILLRSRKQSDAS